MTSVQEGERIKLWFIFLLGLMPRFMSVHMCSVKQFTQCIWIYMHHRPRHTIHCSILCIQKLVLKLSSRQIIFFNFLHSSGHLILPNSTQIIWEYSSYKWNGTEFWDHLKNQSIIWGQTTFWFSPLIYINFHLSQRVTRNNRFPRTFTLGQMGPFEVNFCIYRF